VAEKILAGTIEENHDNFSHDNNIIFAVSLYPCEILTLWE